MGQDHGGGVMGDATANHLTRMDAGPVDGPSEELLVGNDPVAIVQEEAGEDLIRIAVQAQLLPGGPGLGPTSISGFGE